MPRTVSRCRPCHYCINYLRLYIFGMHLVRLQKFRASTVLYSVFCCVSVDVQQFHLIFIFSKCIHLLQTSHTVSISFLLRLDTMCQTYSISCMWIHDIQAVFASIRLIWAECNRRHRPIHSASRIWRCWTRCILSTMHSTIQKVFIIFLPILFEKFERFL